MHNAVSYIHGQNVLYTINQATPNYIRDPQNIASPEKDCGSFIDEKLRALHPTLIEQLQWWNQNRFLIFVLNHHSSYYHLIYDEYTIYMI